MQRLAFSNWETELKLERSRKYVGSASIDLNVFDFHHEVDEQNVDRLIQLFRSKCDRTDTRNHVIATIDKQSLDLALKYSNVTTELRTANAAGSFPILKLPPGHRLQCLHGVDRLAAARRFLPSGDHCWVVNLYLSDLSSNLRLALIDSYYNEKEPLDGDFYTKIREYQKSGNACLEEIWWARLSALSLQKKKNLMRILRSHNYHSAFDCQIQLPGLQKGMKLGTLHTVLSMKCDEENIRYLRYVRDTWTAIFSGNAVAMQKLDSITVKELELTAPGYCINDAARLYRKLQQGRIFKSFGSSEREKIWINVLAVSKDRLIPSLQTFFDDIKYLQGPAECVKRLTGHEASGSTFASLRCRFTDVGQHPNHCIFQVSETQFETRPGNLDYRQEVGYRTVWISAMRNCLEISPKENKRGRDRLAKNSYKEDEIVDCRFGRLAYRVGFESSKIYELTQRSADREIARSALLRARNPKYYAYSTAKFDTYVQKIVDLFNTASEILETSIETTIDTGDQYGDELPNRSGLPKLHHHVEDQKKCFIDALHNEITEGGIINSFFVRRSVYLAFFGHFSDSMRRPQEEDHHNTTEGQSVRSNQTQQTQFEVTNNVEMMDINGEAKHQRIQQDTVEMKQNKAEKLNKTATYTHNNTSRRDKKNTTRLKVQKTKRIPEKQGDGVGANRMQEEPAMQHNQEQDETTLQQLLEEAAAKHSKKVEEVIASRQIEELLHIQEQKEVATKRIQEEEEEEEAAVRCIQKEEEAAAKHLQEEEEKKEAVEARRIQDEEEAAAARRIQEEEEAAAARRIQEEEEAAAAARRLQEEEEAEKHIHETIVGTEVVEVDPTQKNQETIVPRITGETQPQKLAAANRVTQIDIQTGGEVSGAPQFQVKDKALLSENPKALGRSNIREVRSIVPRKRTKIFVADLQGKTKLLRTKKAVETQIRHFEDTRADVEILEKVNGEWVIKDKLSVSPSSAWDTNKFQPYDKRWILQDHAGKQLCEETCFEDVIQDGTCKIYLVVRQDQSRQKLNLSLLRRKALNSRSASKREESELTATTTPLLEVQTKDEFSLDSD